MTSPPSPTHGRAAACALAAAFALAAGGGAVPAAAGTAANPTVVVHGYTHTETFPDDICGDRASVVTFTATVSQSRFAERADGSWSYRDVAAVSFEVDFVDPELTDYSGRLTEVNNLRLTPGETFIVTNTYHDFGGDLKIWERTSIKIVEDDVLVDRFLLEATGCP
jgi:hypothetical protein